LSKQEDKDKNPKHFYVSFFSERVASIQQIRVSGGCQFVLPVTLKILLNVTFHVRQKSPIFHSIAISNLTGRINLVIDPQCLWRDRLVIPYEKNIQGQASWAKRTSLWGKLSALVYHPTKKVNKAE
jgi:hypothetical protein